MRGGCSLAGARVTLMGDFQTVQVDAVRQYWNDRPCNIRHSTQPVGTRAYFDEVEARKYRVEPHIPGFAQFERWAGKRVLEIGCGIGTDTINFARAGAHVTVVELSDKSLDVARQRAEVMGVADRITFHQGNAEQLSDILPAQRFDLVYSFGVIHHTPQPERVLREIAKFTDAQSTLKIMMYHRRSWKVLWIAMGYGKGRFWRLDELIATHSEAQTGCPVTYSYSRASLRSLLSATGFTSPRTRVDHVFAFRIADYVKYRYVKEWYFRWMPPAVFRAFERAFGWHLLAEAKGTDEATILADAPPAPAQQAA